jgi:hypothetical protein
MDKVLMAGLYLKSYLYSLMLGWTPTNTGLTLIDIKQMRGIGVCLRISGVHLMYLRQT